MGSFLVSDGVIRGAVGIGVCIGILSSPFLPFYVGKRPRATKGPEEVDAQNGKGAKGKRDGPERELARGVTCGSRLAKSARGEDATDNLDKVGAVDAVAAASESAVATKVAALAVDEESVFSSEGRREDEPKALMLPPSPRVVAGDRLSEEKDAVV
jgi:hypothetical protein